MKRPYDYPQNKIRKAIAFRKCIEVLQDLKQQAPPIFDRDPQVTGYLEQLQRDFDAMEKSLQEV